MKHFSRAGETAGTHTAPISNVQESPSLVVNIYPSGPVYSTKPASCYEFRHALTSGIAVPPLWTEVELISLQCELTDMVTSRLISIARLHITRPASGISVHEVAPQLDLARSDQRQEGYLLQAESSTSLIAHLTTFLGINKIDSLLPVQTLHDGPSQKRRAVLKKTMQRITLKEYALALTLFQNIESVVEKERLMNAAWPSRALPQRRTLASHLSRVRAKYGLNVENGLRLTSVYGIGYALETSKMHSHVAFRTSGSPGAV